MEQEEAAQILLTRTPEPLPTISIKNHEPGNIFNHMPSDITVHDYNPHPKIKVPVAI